MGPARQGAHRKTAGGTGASACRLGACGLAASGAALLCLLALLPARSAQAYAQFQQYSQKHSGRYTDCAMCHRNHDGPEGLRPGQIGSLTPEEKERYAQEQDAFDAGQEVASPILNEFGNDMVKRMGRLAIVEMAKTPEKLADALGFDSDLDGDGIADAREFLDGTNPVNSISGAPGRLFLINLRRNVFHIVMTVLLTVAGVYGLGHLLGGFTRL